MNKYQKTKTFLLSKLMLAHLILLFTSNAFAQKPFIAKSESNWAQDSITSNISYTIYLVGDAGEPIIDEKTSCMALLKNHLTSANQNSSVIFLGDNIYPNGMVEENSPERHNAEMSIDNQLKTLTNYVRKEKIGLQVGTKIKTAANAIPNAFIFTLFQKPLQTHLSRYLQLKCKSKYLRAKPTVPKVKIQKFYKCI